MKTFKRIHVGENEALPPSCLSPERQLHVALTELAAAFGVGIDDRDPVAAIRTLTQIAKKTTDTMRTLNDRLARIQDTVEQGKTLEAERNMWREDAERLRRKVQSPSAPVPDYTPYYASQDPASWTKPAKGPRKWLNS